MSIDVWIALVACLSGVWGVIVTFWAPATTRKKALCVVPFVVMAFIGVLLIHVQSKQRQAAEQASANALRQTQDAAERTEKELVRVQGGMQVLSTLLAQPKTDESGFAAIKDAVKSLALPFIDTGTALETSRTLRASQFETISNESGAIDMWEMKSGRKLTWTVGWDAPKGYCETGSLYTRSDGQLKATLYVCEQNAWVAK